MPWPASRCVTRRGNGRPNASRGVDAIDGLKRFTHDEARRRWRLRRQITIIAAVGFLLLLGVKPAAAQRSADQVTIKTGPGPGRIVVTGTILDYTGEMLRIRTNTGRGEHRFSSEDVVAVETPQSEPHVKGLEEFSRDRYEQAARQFRAALDVEMREWVQREILALLTRCALKQGDYAAAATHFNSLVQSDPTTRHFRLIPLAWTTEQVTPGWKNLARNWLESDSDATRLIAASVLLDDAYLSDRAEEVLRRLIVHTDDRIEGLARAQRWRHRLLETSLSQRSVDRWQDQIETMPGPVRGGPHYLLGKARLRLGENDQAAAAFLWLPLVYDDDHHLAARACLEAAHALRHLGETEQADRLFREVTTRFGTTPWAREAAQALDASGSEATPSANPS